MGADSGIFGMGMSCDLGMPARKHQVWIRMGMMNAYNMQNAAI